MPLRIALSVLFISMACFPVPAAGEQVIEIDQTAPLLFHTPKSGPAEEGKPLEITARVTDNVKVARVILYYRLNGEGIFQNLQMVNTDKDNYSIIIPGQKIYGSRLEYYLVAEDEAGNKTMKGFSGSPLSLSIHSPGDGGAGMNIEGAAKQAASRTRPSLYQISYSYSTPMAFIGMNLYRFSEQGKTIYLPALAYGVEGEYLYQEDKVLDLGITVAENDSVELDQVSYQNMTGNLFESFSTVFIYAGQRFLFDRLSFLVAFNYFHSRLYDRNLLDSGGSKLARLPDDTNSSLGLTLGMGYFFPLSQHLHLGFDPKVNLLFNGQFNHFTLPVVVSYAF